MLITTVSNLPYVVPEGSGIPVLLRATAARLRRYGLYQGDWYAPQIPGAPLSTPFERSCSVDAALHLSTGCDPAPEEDSPQEWVRVPQLALEGLDVFARYLVSTQRATAVYEEDSLEGSSPDLDTLATINDWNDAQGRTLGEVITALLDCAIRESLKNRK